MTTLAPPPVEAPVVTPPDEPSAPPPSRTRPWDGVDQRTLIVLAVGCALIAVLTGWLFEGPVAELMFNARQHGLGATFATPPPKLHRGQAVAVMQIPRLGTNLVVVEGDGPDLLHGGPGHRPGTVVTGAKGNSVIEAHHSGWGAPFARLAQLHQGDLIAVRNRTVVRRIVFKVQSVRRVQARDVRLLADSTDRRLTLVTGSGGWFSNDRIVVSAVSGPVGKLRPPSASLTSGPTSDSVLANRWLAVASWAGLAAVGAVMFLRRRYGWLATCAVAVPIAAAGLLAIGLELDRLLPPLR